MPLVARIANDSTDVLLQRVRVAVFYEDGPYLRRFDRHLEMATNGSLLGWSEHLTELSRPVEFGTTPGVDPGIDPYMLDCREDIARAVYGALKARFENEPAAPGDAAALRNDLDREYARSDKLLNAVISQLPTNLVIGTTDAPHTERPV